MISQKITVLQLFFIIMISTGLMNHVMVIPVLLDKSGRDAWITVLVAGAPFLAWSAIIFYIYKKLAGKHLFLWLKERVGIIVTYILILSLCIYVFVLAVITLLDTFSFINTFYLELTPKIVVITTILLVCFYNSYKGIRSIGLISGILLPAIVIFGFFVMTANMENKDYSLLKPYLENGYTPIWKGLVSVLAGLTEIVTILFVQQHLNQKLRFKYLLILCIALIGLIIGPLTGAIAEFGPFSTKNQRFPAFEEWRLVSLGVYIEHLDFLAFYQWLSGAYIRISFFIFLVPNLINVEKEKRRVFFLIGLYAVLAIIVLLPISDIVYFQLLKDWILPLSFWFILGVSIFLFTISLFKRKRGEMVIDEA
ncbi:endospore germination permease [Neobacillus drentensis]|uniref:GerAB/ArcD/ProY family transporter n=1 Tax=Neobacillus drentensis TaxID=220684 RepID=UPI002FFF5704